MKPSAHSLFALFLVFLAGTAAIILTFYGWDYYRTPAAERAFRDDYVTMKPSGTYSHGLGIIGSLLIVVGVSIYSSRKRMQVLREIGKLSRWLELHIVLCLIGPILVIYHTTFKVGGVAAITFWTMVSVAGSGIIGRFLYVQIPRNLNGRELSISEINAEIQDAGTVLQQTPIGHQLLALIDGSFGRIERPNGFIDTFRMLFRLQRVKREVKHAVDHSLRRSSLQRDVIQRLLLAANTRATLIQRSFALSQLERLFYYWHAIHLPFSIIMFLTLAAHVAVALYLGYRWI